MLLFTDGLFEVELADEQYYDQLQLLKSVSQRVDLRAEELCRQLVAEVRKFAASKDFEDDVCLIAMEMEHLMKGLCGIGAFDTREPKGCVHDPMRSKVSYLRSCDP